MMHMVIRRGSAQKTESKKVGWERGEGRGGGLWLLALSRLTALYNITKKRREREKTSNSKTLVSFSCFELTERKQYLLQRGDRLK